MLATPISCITGLMICLMQFCMGLSGCPLHVGFIDLWTMPRRDGSWCKKPSPRAWFLPDSDVCLHGRFQNPPVGPEERMVYRYGTMRDYRGGGTSFVYMYLEIYMVFGGKNLFGEKPLLSPRDNRQIHAMLRSC